MGQVTEPQLFTKSKTKVALFARGATNTLTPTGNIHAYDPHSTDSLHRVLCYQTNGAWVYMGRLSSDRGDANGFTIQGESTLSPATPTRLCQATCRDFHDALVSMKFVPPTAMSDGGLWHRGGLMHAANGSQEAQHKEMKHMLAKAKSPWLSRRQQ